jgi:hypothetical protein
MLLAFRRKRKAKKMGEQKTRKIISAVTLIVIVLFYTVWYMKGDNYSITVGIDDQYIGVTATDQEATFIPLETVTNVVMTEEFDPGDCADGLTEDTLYYGKFHNTSLGDYQLCINPEVHTYIVIETTQDTYVINRSSDRVTKDDYEQIRETLEK